VETRPGRLDGKTIAITGGATGIGFETALGLGEFGASLLLVGRDSARGSAAVASLAARSIQASFFACDLSSMAEIRRLTARLGAKTPRLDVLINNAAGIFVERRLTVDGIEATLATNVIAPMSLAEGLLPALEASGAGLILNVASPAYRLVRPRLEDLQSRTEPYRGMTAYARSKLYLVMWTASAARSWNARGIRVWSLGPQEATTELGESAAIPWPSRLLRRWLRLTPARAARALIRVVAGSDVGLPNGGYFDHRGRLSTLTPASRDEVAQEELAVRLRKIVSEAESEAKARS